MKEGTVADYPQRSRAQHGTADFESLPDSFTDATIISQFEVVTARHPDRAAVVDENSRLTYAELQQQSNRLAEVISANCGSVPQPVALILPQGVPAAVAILGVLKAGMYYVPVDCAAPVDWLREVLAAVQPAIVLGDADNLTLARSVAPVGTTVMDTNACVDSGSDNRAPLRIAVPDDTAYIFFTSGSTGCPKGVLDTHRNVLHNVMRYTNALAIRAADRLTLLQSPSFSGSVSSLFCALLNGACAYPVDLRRVSMGTLAAWINEQEISIYHSVPAIFRSTATGSTRFPSVRIVRLEGDRASRRDLERFRRHFPAHALLVNGLGTTETGLVCQFFMDRHTRLTGDALPVGYPSQGIQVQIIDSNGDELPCGQIGEIAVTSRYLAAGYWQRDDLTAAAFEGSDAGDGVRTYRTGDLGRMADYGVLEHLGRADSRIRLRGHWIVPAVIEEALASCPGVDEAAVTVAGNSDNERLVAYLRCRGVKSPDIRELRGHLVARLPAHAMPSRFVDIAELPLTANGKIDRAALPTPDRARPKLAAPYVAPYSSLHQRIVELWLDVLELDQVGVRDDFFELGGDSLAAVQMLAGLEVLAGRKLRPDILLGNATIEELADALLKDEVSSAAPQILNSAGRQQALFFLHGDYFSGGYYVRELARYLGPDQPVVPIRPCGLAGEPVPSSYRRMAEVHIEQIRAVQPEGPYRLGGQCNGGLAAYEIAQLMAERGEIVDRLLLIDASASNLRFQSLRNHFALTTLWGLDQKLGERTFLWVRSQLEWMKQHRGRPRFRLLMGRLARKVMALAPCSSSVSSATEQSMPRNWANLRSAYQRIDSLYFPSTYEGHIVLLWPESNPRENLEEVRYWWEKVCTHMEFREIPGSNVTCLTRHVDALAAAMHEALSD